MKLVSITVLAAISLAAATAHARGKVKAHVECTLDGGLKIKKGQKIPLDKDVFCIVVLDGKGAPPDNATASLWLVEKRSDGPFNTDGQQGAIVGEEDMTYFQFENPFHHGTDFQPCTGFTVHANIVDDQGPLWEGTFAIAAKCEKPKKLSAKLACDMSSGDANFTWPGNGDRLKPRMEGELDCSIQSKTAPPDGARSIFIIGHEDGSTTTPKGMDFTQAPGEKVIYVSQSSFEEEEYKACSNFTLQATVVDANGQTLWVGKQKFKQTCPD